MGLVITKLLTTSPEVSWRGWETPTPQHHGSTVILCMTSSGGQRGGRKGYPTYPLVPYPHTYIALYSRTPKLPVTHTHTHKNKKLLSIPLKLVPSLAKLPSLVTPFPLGGAPPTPNTSHSSFWRHQSNSSVSPLLTFVR